MSKFKGNHYNHMSDIWSFGLTLMELALGRYPFLDGKKAKEYVHMYQFVSETEGKIRLLTNRFFSPFGIPVLS